MDSLDLEVLQRAQRWLGDGHAVMLVTVVRTWGSSPRPAGSLLAMREDGRAIGSVSGGCIEDDLMDRLRKEGMPATPREVSYGVGAEEARRFGLPCGGTMVLTLEPLCDAAALDPLLRAIGEGQLVERVLDMRTGEALLQRGHPEQGLRFDGNTLVSVFGPRYRLLIIGAGQLSAVLARMAMALDFAVTVCDPRAEWADEWQVPGTTLSTWMPDDLVIAMKPDARMAVVALTHDPKLDDLALMEALRTEAFYVAALGSRRNNAARRERLREFDLDEQQVASLRGPAGLFIDSRTPAEIAVSIAAELVAVKNGVAAERVLPVGEAKAALERAHDTLSACRVER